MRDVDVWATHHRSLRYLVFLSMTTCNNINDTVTSDQSINNGSSEHDNDYFIDYINNSNVVLKMNNNY